MPIYDSESAITKKMKGLHLFHFTFSNCSQRVRLALAEKGLSWESHHLDLSQNEHITPEYQAINPKGVVPTLVNDGEVVVESNDIITDLEEHFPQPALVPSGMAERSAMEALIHLCANSHGAIKVITYDRLFRQLLKVDADDIKFLESNRNNKDVFQFMEDFYENSDAWQLRVEAATQKIDDFLARLDKAVSSQPWLSGEAYGLADISWVVNIHRLNTIQYSIDQFENLSDWFDRASSRQAFSDAVSNYQAEPEVVPSL